MKTMTNVQCWVIRVIVVLGAWAVVPVGNIAATVDLPAFYRAPFFQGDGRSDPGNWTSKIMVRYGLGHTWDSFDESSKKHTLLSAAGPMDIARLGFGTTITQASQPSTYQYWNTGNNTANPQFYNRSYTLPAPATGADLPTNNDGKIDLIGRFETQDLGIEFTQYIKYGLFAHVYVPLRQVKLDHIGYHNKGADAVNGQNIGDFFRNQFDTILKEQGMQPLATPFKKSGVSDVTASLGWHGYAKVGSEWIMDLAGNLQAGLLVPIADQLSDKYVAAVPLGYNQSWGFLARGSGEIGVLDWISVGGYADAILFLSQSQSLRMRTFEAQSGWLRLGKGFAKVETGTLWDCGGYVRLGALVHGLSLFGGYSFTRQEATKLTVNDANFTVMITSNVVNGGVAANVLHKSSLQGEKNTVVNSDPRLWAWEMHTLHVGATLELGGKKSDVVPRLQVEYTYPFDGKNIFKTPLLGGTAGLQFSLGF